jgi:hypothetical protein
MLPNGFGHRILGQVGRSLYGFRCVPGKTNPFASEPRFQERPSKSNYRCSLRLELYVEQAKYLAGKGSSLTILQIMFELLLIYKPTS